MRVTSVDVIAGHLVKVVVTSCPKHGDTSVRRVTFVRLLLNIQTSQDDTCMTCVCAADRPTFDDVRFLNEFVTFSQ